MPDIVWEVVIAVFATQIAIGIVRILQSGGKSMYIDPWMFVLLYFFAALGFAGAFFAFIYVVVYAIKRAQLHRRPPETDEEKVIIHLPSGRKVG